jgi:sensor histidine kinase YesM
VFSVQKLKSPNIFIFTSMFAVTQLIGPLLSLVICFVLQDFVWSFIRAALMNSFALGLALVGSCLLTQRLMSKMKITFSIAISFSLMLGSSIFSLILVVVLEPTLVIYYYRGILAFLFVNFLFILALYAISSVLIIYREIMLEKEKVIGTERHLKDQIEMKLLSSKVNPHFLFNTLNMILNLLKQPAQAETALLNLSDLLRYNLEQSEKTSIPVKDELDSVRRYLEIQSLRFGEKLSFNISGDVNFMIPPLILQPLVENCIKHNMKRVDTLTVDVSVSCSKNRSLIKVFDSERKVNESMVDKGQGLTITKKRVENSKGIFLIEHGGIEISFDL